MNKRKLYCRFLNFGMIMSSALMFWKGLMVVTGSESPIIVVLSGNMAPAIPRRGDLLLLTNYKDEPIRVGEIVVFKIEGRDIPIVHRVVTVHEKEDGSVKFLTRGDYNVVDDRGLYPNGQLWLEKKDITGRVKAYLPYAGTVFALMSDHPMFKYAMLMYFGIFVLRRWT